MKNWLIRTHQKQILGPVSKEKIISLIESKKLKDDDEISSGNGYWIWIRETELIQKYIYGNESQSFNPISEAKIVLSKKQANKTSSTMEVKVASKSPAPLADETSDFVLPDQEDLAYPDSPCGEESDEITLIGKLPGLKKPARGP